MVNNAKNKSFIITIDTEGDNLWDINKEISTENARYIPLFQELCEKYGFKPVYLTNYEMARDDFFIEFANDALKRGTCEIGMHLHAWNNPPYYELKTVIKERPYLIEYPIKVMDEKVKIITHCLEDQFNTKIVSHRAGRWVTNENYFLLLKKYGYQVDCSVTPHINWKYNLGQTGTGGTDYSSAQEQPYYIYDEILEVPVTIRKIRSIDKGSIKQKVKTLLLGRNLWMRPLTPEISDMRRLVDLVSHETNTDYIEFMIHSSELMPGCSPKFPDQKSCDLLFEEINNLFAYIKEIGFIGKTLENYFEGVKL